MESSKTFLKWEKRVQDTATPWTENEIIYFRKAVGSSGLKDELERQSLREQFEQRAKKGYGITPEQTEKGINYLKNTCFKKNGSLRDTKKRMTFGLREIAIIKDFYEFKFVGIYDASPNHYRFYTPVYRVIDSRGNAFEYTTNMGEMTVVS